MKKNLFILLLFFSPIFSKETIRIYTLPKSGTHFISEVLNELPVSYKIQHIDLLHNKTNKTPSRNFHFGKKIINIRDLRDYFVSLKNWTNIVTKLPLEERLKRPAYKSIQADITWKEMNNDEQLMVLMTLDSRSPYYEKNILNSILSVDKVFNSKTCLITRFEDWIGEKGGGSYEAYYSTIKKVLAFFGYHNISDSSIQKAYDAAYGKKTKTFYKGKTRSWEKEFNDQHIETFKEYWNKYLIKWGYETDKNW